MVNLIILLLVIVIIIHAVMDDISHHDAYKNLGYFFTKEAAEAPKKNLFHAYFPMFYDAWHLCRFTQVCIYSGIIAILLSNWIMFPVFICVQSLVFIISYQYND